MKRLVKVTPAKFDRLNRGFRDLKTVYWYEVDGLIEVVEREPDGLYNWDFRSREEMKERLGSFGNIDLSSLDIEQLTIFEVM